MGADLTDVLAGDTLDVARGLLGMRIRTEFDGEPTEVMLDEVEAYLGADDPASHAYRSRTARNEALFGPPGTLYVYRSYGIHWCANIATTREGLPHGVLLRGGVPLYGRAAMERRRGRSTHLTDGPGKLTVALGIDGGHDGTSVLDGPVRLLPAVGRAGTIVATPRIGLTRAVEHPWRFVMVRPLTSPSDPEDR